VVAIADDFFADPDDMPEQPEAPAQPARTVKETPKGEPEGEAEEPRQKPERTAPARSKPNGDAGEDEPAADEWSFLREIGLKTDDEPEGEGEAGDEPAPAERSMAERVDKLTEMLERLTQENSQLREAVLNPEKARQKTGDGKTVIPGLEITLEDILEVSPKDADRDDLLADFSTWGPGMQRIAQAMARHEIVKALEPILGEVQILQTAAERTQAESAESVVKRILGPYDTPKNREAIEKAYTAMGSPKTKRPDLLFGSIARAVISERGYERAAGRSDGLTEAIDRARAGTSSRGGNASQPRTKTGQFDFNKDWLGMSNEQFEREDLEEDNYAF